MKRTPPPDYQEIGDVYSNFDHEMDERVAKRLGCERVSAAHVAMDFWALVWRDHESEKWYEMVMQHRTHVDTIQGDTLHEVIDAVNEQYGNA